MKKKILLINPSTISIYSKSMVKVGVPLMPPLTLAVLAAPLLKKGFSVDILDFNLTNEPKKALKEKLDSFNPTHVAITVMTPSYNQLKEVTSFVKKYDKNIITIAGGPHISVFPKQVLKETKLDIAVKGEGDFVLPEIVGGKDLSKIGSVYFKKGKKIYSSKKSSTPIKNIDDLPYPSWDLFDIKAYKTPRLICRRRPVGPIETSRGCIYGCTYCNKCVFGLSFRPKSAKRVVDEIEYMLSKGFKEIHTVDDGFSTDIKRAKKICDLIKKRKLNFTWNIRTGMRIDRVDEELLKKMKDVGCYRISWGVESGSQEILNNVKKGIKIDQIKKVFKWTHKIGIETLAFFMFGLPGETEETMQKTIEFAKELNPHIIKPGILTPLPGTVLFNDWEKKGYIKTHDWSKYTYEGSSSVYNHPTLKWKTIKKYYQKFPREFYFRPKIIFKRLIHDIKNGTLLHEISVFFKIKWW